VREEKKNLCTGIRAGKRVKKKGNREPLPEAYRHRLFLGPWKKRGETRGITFRECGIDRNRLRPSFLFRNQRAPSTQLERNSHPRSRGKFWEPIQGREFSQWYAKRRLIGGGRGNQIVRREGRTCSSRRKIQKRSRNGVLMVLATEASGKRQRKTKEGWATLITDF